MQFNSIFESISFSARLRRGLIFILFISYQFKLEAQTSFTKGFQFINKYDIDTNHGIRSKNLIFNNNKILIFNTSYTSNYTLTSDNFIQVREFDLIQKKLTLKKINLSFLLKFGIRNLEIIYDNKNNNIYLFTICATRQINSNDHFLSIIKLDSNYKLVWSKFNSIISNNFTVSEINKSIKIIKNNIFFSYEKTYNSGNCKLIKMDINGNIKKTINFSNLSNYISPFIHNTFSDDGFVIQGNDYPLYNLYRLDTSLNIIRLYKTPNYSDLLGCKRELVSESFNSSDNYFKIDYKQNSVISKTLDTIFSFNVLYKTNSPKYLFNSCLNQDSNSYELSSITSVFFDNNKLKLYYYYGNEKENSNWCSYLNKEYTSYFSEVIIDSTWNNIKKISNYFVPNQFKGSKSLVYDNYSKKYYWETNLLNNINFYNFDSRFYEVSSNSNNDCFFYNKARDRKTESFGFFKNHDFSILPHSVLPCSDLELRVDTILLSPRPITQPLDDTFSLTDFPVTVTIDTLPETPEVPLDFRYMNLIPDAKYDLADTICTKPINVSCDTSCLYASNSWIYTYRVNNKKDTYYQFDTTGYTPLYSGWLIIQHDVDHLDCHYTYTDSVYIHSTIHQDLNLGRDTLACPPISLRLSATNLAGTSYLWQNASTDSVMTITDTGKYYCRISNECGLQSDTFIVKFKRARTDTNFIALSSKKICSQLLPYTLNAVSLSSPYQYLWSNGKVTPSISLSSFGTYRLTVTDGCHIYRDSFRLIAQVVATPPTHPATVSLCASTYTIHRPLDLTLEEKIGSTWVSRDSIVLSKNQSLDYRWTDSCGAVTTKSIRDIQVGVFAPLPKQVRICDLAPSYIDNALTSIQQYEYSGGTYTLNHHITLKLGPNYIRRIDSCTNIQDDTVIGYRDFVNKNLIIPPQLDLCLRETPYTLTISDTFNSYIWTSGSTTYRSILSTQHLEYVQVDDGCYIYLDSIQVNVNIPSIENALILDNITLCKSQVRVEVSTPLIYPQYIWNQTPSISRQRYYDTSSTLVRLHIPRICDTLRDSMSITWVDPILAQPVYSSDSSYCDLAEGAVKLILLNASDYSFFAWNGDSSSASTYVNSYKSNILRARNLCYDREFVIPSYYCPLNPVGLPAAFSPNGDNLNERWGLQGAKSLIVHKLMIFNRWGEKVYEVNSANDSWDGTYKGEPCPAGIYSYHLDYEYIPQHVRRVYNGEVVLVR